MGLGGSSAPTSASGQVQSHVVVCSVLLRQQNQCHGLLRVVLIWHAEDGIFSSPSSSCHGDVPACRYVGTLFHGGPLLSVELPLRTNVSPTLPGDGLTSSTFFFLFSLLSDLLNQHIFLLFRTLENIHLFFCSVFSCLREGRHTPCHVFLISLMK